MELPASAWLVTAIRGGANGGDTSLSFRILIKYIIKTYTSEEHRESRIGLSPCKPGLCAPHHTDTHTHTVFPVSPQLESEVKTIPLSPVELLDLELATSYRVAGRCRVQDEEDLWSEWSPSVSFQTPPFGEHTSMPWAGGGMRAVTPQGFSQGFARNILRYGVISLHSPHTPSSTIHP